MKILIIASQVGKSAPGIVFERLIKGLSLHYDLDVITSNFSPSIDLSALNRVTVIPLEYKHPTVERILISLLNINFSDIIWANKAKKKCEAKYKLIFSF